MNNGFDAKQAGINDSVCTLYICSEEIHLPNENYGVAFINPANWDIQGLFYLELIEHPDITNIKKFLCLQFGKDYSKPENYSQLRYKNVVIKTDDKTRESVLWYFNHYYHSMVPYISYN